MKQNGRSNKPYPIRSFKLANGKLYNELYLDIAEARDYIEGKRAQGNLFEKPEEEE